MRPGARPMQSSILSPNPNYPISLQRNDIGHISDGEYLSEMFYVALSLGVGAIISFGIYASFAIRDLLYIKGDNIGHLPSGKPISYII